MSTLIEVNLIKEVAFSKDSEMITIPIDTVVLCSPMEEYAYYNGDRFDIFRDEYCLTN